MFMSLLAKPAQPSRGRNPSAGTAAREAFLPFAQGWQSVPVDRSWQSLPIINVEEPYFVIAVHHGSPVQLLEIAHTG